MSGILDITTSQYSGDGDDPTTAEANNTTLHILTSSSFPNVYDGWQFDGVSFLIGLIIMMVPLAMVIWKLLLYRKQAMNIEIEEDDPVEMRRYEDIPDMMPEKENEESNANAQSKAEYENVVRYEIPIGKTPNMIDSPYESYTNNSVSEF
ncbi:uncharacterized protein LOC120334904 [Styela clava]